MDVDQKRDTTDAKPSATKEPIWLAQPLSFWGNSLLQKQILTLVESAAPLDLLEKYIKQAKNEPFLQATLVQAIQRALIGLDQTIRDEKGNELDEGMAERLITLHAELFPSKHEEALEQVRLAAPQEDKEAKQKREQLNIDAMQNLFTAFIGNDAIEISDAITTFKQFVKNLKPAVLTNNQYYLNLLHLLSVAFDVLANNAEDFPPIDNKDSGSWYGELGTRFCFEIIGDALESDLSPRTKQILRARLEYVLQGTQKVNRDIDISGALYRNNDLCYVLGVSGFYNDFGLGPVRRATRTVAHFKTYYEQLHQLPKLLIQVNLSALQNKNG